MLPSFIVIGAMKSGTTSLHHYLSKHPEIGMSHCKELDFFKDELTFAKGINWYTSQFPNGFRLVGESSPNYSKCHLFPGVAERLHSVLPNISLIYVVRDPVDRAVSHYMHQVAAGKESRSMEEAFQDLNNNDYVPTGAYMFQLNQFLKFYPSERILIIESADLLNDRANTLAGVFSFLGVDETFHSDSFTNVRHKSSLKRQSKLLNEKILNMPGISSIITPKMISILRRTVGKKIERPKPSMSLKARLLEHYLDDIKALEKFADKSFKAWYELPTSGS